MEYIDAMRIILLKLHKIGSIASKFGTQVLYHQFSIMPQWKASHNFQFKA